MHGLRVALPAYFGAAVAGHLVPTHTNKRNASGHTLPEAFVSALKKATLSKFDFYNDGRLALRSYMHNDADQDPQARRLKKDGSLVTYDPKIDLVYADSIRLGRVLAYGQCLFDSLGLTVAASPLHNFSSFVMLLQEHIEEALAPLQPAAVKRAHAWLVEAFQLFDSR